jgi:hypothetical protein
MRVHVCLTLSLLLSISCVARQVQYLLKVEDNMMEALMSQVPQNGCFNCNQLVIPSASRGPFRYGAK